MPKTFHTFIPDQCKIRMKISISIRTEKLNIQNSDTMRFVNIYFSFLLCLGRVSLSSEYWIGVKTVGVLLALCFRSAFYSVL